MIDHLYHANCHVHIRKVIGGDYMAKRINKKENKLEDFCALWEQKSKNGLEYLTGKDADGNKIVAFYNESKKNPKEPDIRVYFSNDED